MPTEFESVIDDIRAAAKQDYVGLWEICIKVRRKLHPDSPLALKDLVLGIVRQLLASGFQAVDLSPPGSGCRPWVNQDPAYVIVEPYNIVDAWLAPKSIPLGCDTIDNISRILVDPGPTTRTRWR